MEVGEGAILAGLLCAGCGYALHDQLKRARVRGENMLWEWVQAAITAVIFGAVVYGSFRWGALFPLH